MLPFEIGRTQIIAIGAAVLLVLVVVLATLSGGWGQGALREEVPTNVEAIRMSEIGYHGAFDSYVSATASPRDVLDVDAKAVPWVPSDGFKKLSWEPAQAEVRGSYSVNANAAGFTVTGVCDVDEDLVQARFTATLDEGAKAVTDESIY